MPPNDKDPRFVAISDELISGVDDPAPLDARRDQVGDLCSRCGLSAFEPETVAGSMSLLCRACPPPAPYYVLPDGLIVPPTKLYCCNTCGRLSQVTMTLSDVNLYCGRCGVLRLHSRKAEPSDIKIITPNREISPVQFDWAGSRATVKQSLASSGAAQTIDALTSDIEFMKFANAAWAAAWAADAAAADAARAAADLETITIDAMRRKLGLMDFDEYADQVRVLRATINLNDDMNRGTGRTTMGILAAFRLCIERRSDLLLVRGHNPTYSRDLTRIARKLYDQLNLPYLTRCEIMFQLVSWYDRPQVFPESTSIYVDHYATDPERTKNRP